MTSSISQMQQWRLVSVSVVLGVPSGILVWRSINLSRRLQGTPFVPLSLDMGSAECSTDHRGYTIPVRAISSLVGFEQLSVFTVNDEPGTMLPGHCFTIEVIHAEVHY